MYYMHFVSSYTTPRIVFVHHCSILRPCLLNYRLSLQTVEDIVAHKTTVDVKALHVWHIRMCPLSFHLTSSVQMENRIASNFNSRISAVAVLKPTHFSYVHLGLTMQISPTLTILHDLNVQTPSNRGRKSVDARCAHSHDIRSG